MIRIEIKKGVRGWWALVQEADGGIVGMPFRANFDACQWALSQAKRLQEKIDASQERGDRAL